MNISILRAASVLLCTSATLSAPSFAAPSGAGTPSGAGAPVAQRPQADAARALVRWQAALDQLALGHKVEARTLLEQARTQYGDAPEINLLLAWLAEQRGQSASELLAPIARQSRLAAVWTPASPVPAPELMPIPAADDTIVMQGAEMRGGADATVSRATQSQNDARLAALEAYMVNRVNAERRALGLRPLKTDSLLADTARAHSAEMRDKKYFAHESPTASLAEPLDRYRAAFHETPSLVAENIYRSWGGQRHLGEKDIDEAHAGLMKSAGHRENILLPQATRIGIGIAVTGNGDLWVTQMFARD